MNFIQDLIMAGVPIFFAWRSGGFWVWVYVSGVAVAEIAYLWSFERILPAVDDWLREGSAAAIEEDGPIETAVQ